MQIISAAGFTLIPPRDKMANFVILKSPIKILAQIFIYTIQILTTVKKKTTNRQP